MTLKTCNTCNVAFPKNNFSGRSGKCKPCRNFLLRKRRSENIDEVNKQNRESYYRNKPARILIQKRYAKKRAILEKTDKLRHAKYLIQAAKARSRKFKLPFCITYKDIPIPEYCPILKIKLFKNNKISFNSATVDRIIPNLGYIPGNVIVISCKANQIKNNGTPDEILKVGYFFKNLLGEMDDSKSETKT